MIENSKEHFQTVKHSYVQITEFSKFSMAQHDGSEPLGWTCDGPY
jgi:hypothetical protein